MYFYKNGSEAKIGDIVHGWVYDHPYKITGKTIGLTKGEDEDGFELDTYICVAHIGPDTIVLLPSDNEFDEPERVTIIKVCTSFGNLQDFDKVAS